MWRRVNVFLYINEDWDENWGGHLEFWDAAMTRMEVQIAPLFNRLVSFFSIFHHLQSFKNENGLYFQL